MGSDALNYKKYTYNIYLLNKYYIYKKYQTIILLEYVLSITTIPNLTPPQSLLEVATMTFFVMTIFTTWFSGIVQSIQDMAD